MDSTFPLLNRSSTCREGGQLYVIIVWCDNIGLVSLIYLGWEFMCGVYYSIMRTIHPDFVCLLFVPSLYSTFEFFICLSPLLLCSVMIVEGILCIRFVHMCVSDSIVCSVFQLRIKL